MKHQQITEIDRDGKIKACEICGNPNPGMSHRCTYYLKTRLARFGGHTDECEITRKSYFVSDGKGGWRKAKCDCGWSKLEKWLAESWGVDEN